MTISSNNLYIRFVGSNLDNTSVIPIADLSKSLYGFSKVINEFAHICRLNGEIEINATTPEEGSFVVGVLVHFKINAGQLPFDSINHLIEFLKLTSNASLEEAHIFFKNINNLHDGLNLFFEKHPFDVTMFMLLIPKLIDMAKKAKNTSMPPDKNIPKRVAKEIYGMISKNSFRRLLWPIINETVKSIEVSNDRKFSDKLSRIDGNNFGQLLGKGNEILPELVDGEIYSMQGVVTSFKSTRGDSITFRYRTLTGTFNLDILPPAGIDTRHFISCYKEHVVISARVERSSVYKKPKLHLISMVNMQQMLPESFEIEHPPLLYHADQIDYKNISGLLPYHGIRYDQNINRENVD